MDNDFRQIEWDETLVDDCRQLIRLAVREDLDRGHDWTTAALVDREIRGVAHVVARQPGIVAGLPAAALVLTEMQADVGWNPHLSDGDRMTAGTTIATLQGSARDMLTCERPLLNMLGRLCGIATLTDEYVKQIVGSNARIYDTRKTTPGWRRLEKYAVRCGGGNNHRTGLFDAVLIKDNHLAVTDAENQSLPAAVTRARDFLANSPIADSEADMLVEVEVDSLDQLRQVLPASPDIVLLDNLTADSLRQAVMIRDDVAPEVQLEASGGITLETVREISATGVERISVGALTHSSGALDIGLDWQTAK